MLALLTVSACGRPAAETELQPGGITLADAPEVLDLSQFLPNRFMQRDPVSHGLSKEIVGLSEDSSEVVVFLSVEPYQLLYWFLRVVESEEDRWDTNLAMYDEDKIKSIMAGYLKAAATRQGEEDAEPEVLVSYPDIAGGAILGEGLIELTEMEMTIRFDMLWLRSCDEMVFVYLYSWSVTEERESLIPIASEIEHRIANFTHND
jgi:hypothetical protein